MTIIGHNFIGGSRSAQGTTLLKAFMLRLVKLCLMSFTMPPSKRLIRYCEAASQAFKTYRHTSPEQRAVFRKYCR